MGTKRYNTLNRSWKELLFSASGFGPNLLMVIMGAFLSNAINPAALESSGSTNWQLQTITGTCLVLPVLFSILWMVAKCFDGIIDIPFAAITDGLRTRWGNRRIPIAICFIPMVVSYAMCWFPITRWQIGFTIWLFFWALLFFSTYSFNLIAFYGSLSTVCISEKQRSRISAYKSFFDTITYCLAYALVPVILNAANIHIDKLVYCLLPLMLTMIIPLFMIKEGQKWEAKARSLGYYIPIAQANKRVTFKQSLILTKKNKPFLKWLLVNSFSFLGLQLFLVSMNALIIGGMGLNGTQMTIINTCAFAPVPFMLYLFNKLKKRKGIRFAYQVSLLSFAIGILSFLIGSRYVMGNNIQAKMIIGAIGGLIGSFGIGSFFMMSYLVPAQISNVELQLTGHEHTSMYFATQAVTIAVAGAASSSLLWENIKNLFFSNSVNGIVQAENVETAASILGVPTDNIFNFGVMLVPIITCLFCLIGFGCAFLMPKNYTAPFVGSQIIGKQQYQVVAPTLKKQKEYPIENGSLIVYNGLWILSATLFGFAWYASLIDDINTFASKKISKWWILLVLLFFPFGAILSYWMNKQINNKCIQLNISNKKNNVPIVAFSGIYLNCVSLSIMQHKINKIVTQQRIYIDNIGG